jgi:hypothetical protein
MKVILSTTTDDLYLFNLPIVSWCWNRLGVEVICFIPTIDNPIDIEKKNVILDAMEGHRTWLHAFEAPVEKRATYSQLARLYGAALTGLDDNEVLVTSDIDMAVFSDLYLNYIPDSFTIYGFDLTPQGQWPICYLIASVKTWKEVMRIEDRTLQECLDDALGHENMDNMRGNLWARDQETIFNQLRKSLVEKRYIPRAREGTQFATNRCDRDDFYWRDRVDANLVDAHLWRPLYSVDNFGNLLTLLQKVFPHDNFDWLIKYHTEYTRLLK